MRFKDLLLSHRVVKESWEDCKIRLTNRFEEMTGTIESQLTGYEERLEMLGHSVDTLQSENARLKQDLQKGSDMQTQQKLDLHGFYAETASVEEGLQS